MTFDAILECRLSRRADPRCAAARPPVRICRITSIIGPSPNIHPDVTVQ
jgi:hypothetical protein